jgi:competence protein ComEC
MAGRSVRAALIAPDAAKPTPAARARRFLRDQIAAQALRWRLWAPVAFGGGCAIYFGLPSEPPVAPLVIVAAAAAGVWQAVRRRGAGRAWTLPLMLLACLALGLATARLRTEAVAAPVAPASDGPTVIEGWVVDVDSPGAAGPRVVLAPVRIRGLAPEATPVRLRATLRGEAPPPGTPVRLYAILNPPPAPASPGAYDFGRAAFFQRIGGVALAVGETRPTLLPEPPWRLRQVMAVNAVRYDLARRIVARLGPRTGGVAAAMTTGHEAWLDPDEVEAMRDSGIAHILSISGLHMAVVGGFAFFLVRLLVAAWPWLALRAPGKKVAAVAGLLAVSVYLVISGAPPPAERAAITAGIAFVAVLLDRQAITMHALAVAALVVLALQPEAIVTPGFQMSFAATAALVALVEAWPRRPKEISAPWPILAVQRTGAWLGAAVLASLVAGAATGPFAMQHFNRVAMYGLAANLTVAPLSDFLVMPALALGALLEPAGLGGPFLWLAGQGIDATLAVGRQAAGLPGAVRTVASAPDAALPVAFLGVLFICLWRGPLRWLGLPFACAVLLWPRPPAPDLWIGDGGTQAAYVRGREAVAVRPGVREFAVDVWSRRRGLTAAARPAEGWACSRLACAPTAPEAGPVALWWGRRPPQPAEIAGMCRSAAVVAVRAEVAALPAVCDGRLVLDGVDLARGGAVELWRDGPPAAGRWRASWTADARGDRPWSRMAAAPSPG